MAKFAYWWRTMIREEAAAVLRYSLGIVPGTLLPPA